MSTPKSMIIVFAIDGCEACGDFKPRFEKMVNGFRKHGVPMIWWSPNRQVKPGEIPVLIVDAGSQDPSVVGLADQHQISALPSTLLLTHNARPVKLEGAIDDTEIYQVLVSATYANR